MNFSEKELEKLVQDISLYKEIDLLDIPCVDLYMDQVTTLFEDRLSYLKRDAKENILTKTMINNYAKAKILTPVKNKKYNKQQIITLIFIYHLKQILSLEDINLLFAPVVKALNSNTLSPAFVDDLYEKFLSIKREQYENFPSDLQQRIEKIMENQTETSEETRDLSQMLLTVLTLINSSIVQKRMAEKIIDKYFKNEEQ